MKQKLSVLLAFTVFSVNLLGQKAPKFTLSGEKYPELLQVVDTSVWIATNEGTIEQYTRKGKLIKSLRYETETFSPYVNCFYVVGDTTIWVGANDGIALYDGNSWRYITDAIGNSDVTVIQPVGADIWIGTESAGAFIFTNFEKTLSISELLPTDIAKNISSIYPASNGDVWIGIRDYYGGGALRYTNGQATYYGETKGLKSGYVGDIIEGTSGEFWIATDYDGVFKWQPTLDTIIQYSTNKGLDYEYVNGIVKDAYDTIWIATETGLSKYIASEDTMYSYSSENSSLGKYFQPEDIMMFGNDIALADGNGFCIFDRTSFRNYDTILNTGSTLSGKIAVGGDSLFYLSSDGTAVYHQGALSTLTIGKIGTQFLAAAQAPDKNIWYVAGGPLITMQDTLGFWHSFPRIFGGQSYSFKDISFNPNGEVWLATDLGIAIYRKGTWDTIAMPIHAGLKGKKISDVSFLDSDTYCIATEEGLYYYDNGSVTEYTTESGLYSNVITKAGFAPDGSLWAVAYEYRSYNDSIAICRFQGGSWKQFSYANSFNMQWCTSLTFDSNGNPWFTGADGDTKLIMFNGEKWLNYTDSLVVNDGVVGIVFNSEGQLWGIYDYPRQVFSFDGNRFTSYTNTLFSTIGSFNAISLDKDDNLLISCYYDGVIEMDKPIRVSFNADTVCVGLKTLLTSNTEPQVNAYKWELVGESETTIIGTDPSITYDFKDNGKYTVKLTVYDGVDSNWVSKTIDRNLILPYSEQLKLVTAAENNDKIIVAWEKTPGKGTAYYNIYRLEADGFIPAGKTMYDQPSYFLDTEANFKERAYTYRITTVDNCGTESDIEISNEHTSMHLLKIPYGQDFQLIWSKYLGVSNPKYIVYETSKTGTDTVRIATLPSINNSYTVLKYNGNMTYRVAIDLGYKVYPEASDLKSDSGPYSQSLSNLAESFALEGVMLSNGFNAIVYPIPAIDICNVSIDEAEPADYYISLVNEEGKTVYTQNINNVCTLNQPIPVKDLEHGAYILTISSSKGTNSTVVTVQ